MASSYSSILKPGGGTLNRLYSQLKGFQLVGGSTSIPPSTCPKLIRQYSQSLSLLNLTLKPTRNASLLPIIKAQGSPDYFPDANFYKVEAILSLKFHSLTFGMSNSLCCFCFQQQTRPWRIPQVSSALLKMGIRGVTVSDVRGFGAQGGLTERQAGSEFSEDKFLAKVKLEIVVSKEQVEAVIDKIIEVTRTGEIGDGKIFLVPVSDVIRVRTGERGEKAERMAGGRADIKTKCFEDEGEEGSDDGVDVGVEMRKEVLHARRVAGAAEFEDERKVLKGEESVGSFSNGNDSFIVKEKVLLMLEVAGYLLSLWLSDVCSAVEVESSIGLFTVGVSTSGKEELPLCYVVCFSYLQHLKVET
ncbi:hypothetical protein RHGRI_003134 [Rhododendron griersonianum]|uniref:PII protein n=1 Tax=Rhododendron griersonianum TaxID=479676 RepID=A0AAV6LTU6_9ERIC|nr:hypothetical protein RHGRI_003134 [Rhododendron griersonianum]